MDPFGWKLSPFLALSPFLILILLDDSIKKYFECMSVEYSAVSDLDVKSWILKGAIPALRQIPTVTGTVVYLPERVTSTFDLAEIWIQMVNSRKPLFKVVSLLPLLFYQFTFISSQSETWKWQQRGFWFFLRSTIQVFIRCIDF